MPGLRAFDGRFHGLASRRFCFAGSRALNTVDARVGMAVSGGEWGWQVATAAWVNASPPAPPIRPSMAGTCVAFSALFWVTMGATTTGAIASTARCSFICAVCSGHVSCQSNCYGRSPKAKSRQGRVGPCNSVSTIWKLSKPSALDVTPAA